MTEPTNTHTVPAVDLTDPRTHLRPDRAAFWSGMRSRQPVAWHPPSPGKPGFWVVSTHALAVEVLRDQMRFTSRNGNMLASLLAGGDSATGRMLEVSDSPRHRQIRRELMRWFTPTTLDTLTRRIHGSVSALVAAAVAAGSCDFAADVAERIPLDAICDLLGIPEQDRDAVFADTSATLAAKSADADPSIAALARNNLLFLFTRLHIERGGEPPGDDLIGKLVEMARGPLALTDDEVVFNCYSLLLGGEATTRLALVGVVELLARRPDVLARLRAGELDTRATVEELLRWTTPIIHEGRTAVVDTELAGVSIKAGQIVTAWACSANFDEEEFAEPHRFDPDRTPNRHLTLGHGPHFCLGAALARIEITALLEALAEHVGGVGLAGAPQPIHSIYLSGNHSLPIWFTPPDWVSQHAEGEDEAPGTA